MNILKAMTGAKPAAERCASVLLYQAAKRFREFGEGQKRRKLLMLLAFKNISRSCERVVRGGAAPQFFCGWRKVMGTVSKVL
jgi:hypothetical protein